ncbi:MAG: hypothetical protein ACREXR_10345 [Gammaproteobacteria bacterium]
MTTAKGTLKYANERFVRRVAVRNYQGLWARNAVNTANFPTPTLDA